MNDALRPSLALSLPNAEATADLGRWLAQRLTTGDTLLLEGGIGAGKTHLARALIQARMAAAGAAPEDVPSPSFTLVQVYAAGAEEIWHVDLYRLSGSGDVAELGLDTALGTALCIIEWPDRLGPLRPRDALTLALADHGEGRRALLRGGPRYDALISDLTGVQA